MARLRRNPWIGVGLDAWSLGLEASAVIGLRTLRIARGGPSGDAEARRMVEEKVRAAMELQALALSGGLAMAPHRAAAKTVAHYRRKVRANQRRLLKG